MYEEHPVFKTPDDNSKIWRYMDISKLLSLLDKSSLFFPSAMKLAEDDPYEGSYARGNLDYDPSKDPSFAGKNPKLIQNFELSRKQGRKWTRDTARKGMYINSWYMNEHESAAMWRSYAENKNGIAVQTTVGKLKATLQKCKEIVYIGEIQYIDYETSTIPENNLFWNFIHKRTSFEHEKELRAIFFDFRVFDPVFELKKGILVPINVNDLIESIYVSPTAPNWTKELIKSVLKKYKLGKDIKKSDLSSDGLW